MTTIGVGLRPGNINLFIAATASGDGNAAGPELVDAVENDPNFRVNMWNDTRGESFRTTRQAISSDDQAEPYAITPANGAAIAATIADWQAGDSVRVSFLITP